MNPNHEVISDFLDGEAFEPAPSARRWPIPPGETS